MSIWTRFLGGSSVVERGAVNSVVEGSIPSLPAISRRGFLLGAAATAVAAPSLTRAFFGPPRGGWPIAPMFGTDALRFKVTERYSQGWTNPKGLYGSVRGMTSADFRKAVEPELNRIFSEVYAQHEEEWKEIYADDGVALRSTPHPMVGTAIGALVGSELNPEAIETLEMEKRFRSDGSWYLKVANENDLKRFERKSPIRISTGRHWWK